MTFSAATIVLAGRFRSQALAGGDFVVIGWRDNIPGEIVIPITDPRDRMGPRPAAAKGEPHP